MGSSPCKSKVEGEVIVTLFGALEHHTLPWETYNTWASQCLITGVNIKFSMPIQPPPDSTRVLSARDITYKYTRYQRSLSTPIPSQLNLY